MSPAEIALLVAWFVGSFGVWFWIDTRWSRSRLKAWSIGEKLTLLQRERRYLRKGPYDFFGQYWVFRVRVRGAEGKEKAGWVRLGGWFAGPWSDEAEARWDPPS